MVVGGLIFLLVIDRFVFLHSRDRKTEAEKEWGEEKIGEEEEKGREKRKEDEGEKESQDKAGFKNMSCFKQCLFKRIFQ